MPEEDGAFLFAFVPIRKQLPLCPIPAYPGTENLVSPPFARETWFPDQVLLAPPPADG